MNWKSCFWLLVVAVLAAAFTPVTARARNVAKPAKPIHYYVKDLGVLNHNYISIYVDAPISLHGAVDELAMLDGWDVYGLQQYYADRSEEHPIEWELAQAFKLIPKMSSFLITKYWIGFVFEPGRDREQGIEVLVATMDSVLAKHGFGAMVRQEQVSNDSCTEGKSAPYGDKKIAIGRGLWVRPWCWESGQMMVFTNAKASDKKFEQYQSIFSATEVGQWSDFILALKEIEGIQDIFVDGTYFRDNRFYPEALRATSVFSIGLEKSELFGWKDILPKVYRATRKYSKCHLASVPVP